jgi:hypothetical protein
MRTRILGAALLLLTVAASCKHEVETYSTEIVSDYMPLSPGKYITYQLDSTVFTGFGKYLEVHSYQEKNLVDAPYTDNLGRPGFRIIRYLRDSAGRQPWMVSGTYYITPTDKTVEVVENNLRTVRLALPIKPGFSWHGNNYLPDDVYEPTYNFSNDNALNTWEYAYGEPTAETIGDSTLDQVLPVYHTDEADNTAGDFEVLIDTSYASRSFSMDKYAKGIGLVQQDLILWDYQNIPKIDRTAAPPTTTYDPFYTGFGVRRRMLDHN